jgi:hypothetical protein
MPSRKSAATNTRNLFDNAHGAGKGDKSRVTNTAAYVENFPASMGNGPRAFRKTYGVQKPKPIGFVAEVQQCYADPSARVLPDGFGQWAKSPSFIIH